MDAANRPRIILLFFLALSIGALILLTGGLANVDFQPGEPLNLLDWFLAQLESAGTTNFYSLPGEPTNEDLLAETGNQILSLVIVSFWLILVASIVYAIVSPQFRRDLLRMLMLVLILLWVFPLIADNIAENRNREAASEARRDYQFDEPTLPEPPTYLENPPEWLFVVINLLLLAGLFGGIYALWRRLRPKSETHAVVVTEVRRALSRLDAGGELSDVVIDCYARMVQGLEKRRRVKRHQAMTPREFEAYLADSGIASKHIHQLTELFELARYGARPASRETERQATQCLQAILEVYGE